MTEQSVISEEFRPDLSLQLAPTEQQPQEAPAHYAGSFLVDESGKCPVDEYTGMPLPIAPRSDIDSKPRDATNIHHHFYPRLNPVLRQTLGGRALRVSRMQLVAATQHNFGHAPFHKFFPEGPSIPTDPAEQLGLCVLACAGYLPPKVVDTSTGEPIVRSMLEREFRQLSQPRSYAEPLAYQVKRFRDRRFPGLGLVDAKTKLITSRQVQAKLTYKHLQYGFDPMKSFVVDYVLGEDVSDIKQEARQFVESGDIESGLCLLAIASLRAARSATIKGESLHDVYKDIASDGRLHPLMPPNASTLIKFKLGTKQDRIELLPLLRARLELARDLGVA